MTKPLYAKLHALSKEAALFSSMQALLDWDQETYLPEEAAPFRAQQLEALAHLVHKKRTSPALGKLLAQLKAAAETLDERQRAALREWERDYEQAVKLPAPFVKKWAVATSHAVQAWKQAKAKDTFALFAPHLEKMVVLARKKADHLGYKEHPYDALLDLFEPGMTIATLVPLFERLKVQLTQLLRRIPREGDKLPEGPFEKERQMRFGKKILHTMGFDDKTSRLDQSAHPFCSTLYPLDVRMTTRIHTNNLMSNLFSVLHEGGHGLYGRHLPRQDFGSPLAEPISLGIDESQSRFWETLIGHSLPFWHHFYPLLQKEFPDAFATMPLEAFYKAVNHVCPSFIRVEADEVCYNLHIILRFELEKGLIEGSLKVKQIPALWREKMRELLGITPATDALGCLQDIHWAFGAFGYFPTYALGNLYAAQLFETFEQAHPHWKDLVSQGNLVFIAEWLGSEIHRYGRQYTPKEMILKVTGKALSDLPYLSYLEKKYTPSSS